MTKEEWWASLKEKKPGLVPVIKDWPGFGEVLFMFQGMVIHAEVIKSSEHTPESPRSSS